MAVALHARQRIREIREVLKHDRYAALNELEDIFREGAVPESLLDGRFSGQFITTTYQPSIDVLVRFGINKVILWKGSSFDIETGCGDNVIASSMGWLIKLLVGRNRCIEDRVSRRTHALGFEMSFGTSLHYPDQEVLIADYCTDENSTFISRVLNEIVEIGDGYFLGRVMMRQKPCRWVCRAYMTLSELPEGIGRPWMEQAA